MLGSLSRIPAAHPIKFGVGISAIKTSAADFVAQRVVEGRDTLDRRRTAIFFVWGLVRLHDLFQLSARRTMRCGLMSEELSD